VEAGLSPARGARVSFEPAAEADAHALADLRVAAMRASLEHIGRFDAARARMRFLDAWCAEQTRHVVVDGQCVVVRPVHGGLLLDHLYVRPGFQGRGIGAAVLADVFAHADARGCGVRVGALRDSDANRFYLRHGFQLVERGEHDNDYRRPPHGPAALR
jgi:GNAT superfamily N-acetyltransferase